MTTKVGRFVRRLTRLPSTADQLVQSISRIEDAASHLYTMDTLLRSQAAFLRQHQESVTDLVPLGNPFEDVMRNHQGMWLPVEESRFQQWMKDGTYQREQYESALSFVTSFDIAIDAGANVGFFAKPLSERFGVVHAFEPVWPIRACLARNVRQNCILYPYALSDRESKVEIEYTLVASGGGQIAGTWHEDPKFALSKQPARAVTVDGLGLPKVDLLKIDVQGHEANVIRGARETLERSSAVILCEYVVSGVENDQVEGLLREIGYVLRRRIGKDGVFTRPESAT